MSRLIRVMQKAERGEEITIAAIGGSITAGGMQTKNPSNRYVAQVAAWFTKKFPKAKVKFVNAGIGGTNSVLGSLRVKADVLDKNPDLVIVEFAVNNKTGIVYNDSLEGLVRQILTDPRQIAVIELFFMHASGDSEQKPMELVGKYYDLPMISFHDAWWPEMMAGNTKWYDMYADVVHPNDKGHTLATELMVFLFEKARSEALSGAKLPQIPSTLPPPMISDTYTRCSLAQGPALVPVANNGWRRTANGRSWESGNADTSIEFETVGTVLFLGFDVDKPTEALTTYSIDGASPMPLKMEPNRPPLATGLAPGKHRIKISYAGSKAHAAKATPTPATGAQPAATPWPDPAGQAPAKLSIWGIGSAGK
jgi:lysophospholipase L1-like esterase